MPKVITSSQPGSHRQASDICLPPDKGVQVSLGQRLVWTWTTVHGL